MDILEGYPLLATVAERFNTWAVILLMVSGLYIVVAKSNMIKTLIGMALFQTSVYLLYLSPGKIIGATPPITDKSLELYSNPLPHVLILTAIVVGVATLAMGLALIVRINEAYGSIEEDDVIDVVDREDQSE